MAAIKPSDTTTNLISVSAVGETWRMRTIAAESMGGAFRNRLAAANEATKKKYVVALHGCKKS